MYVSNADRYVQFSPAVVARGYIVWWTGWTTFCRRRKKRKREKKSANALSPLTKPPLCSWADFWTIAAKFVRAKKIMSFLLVPRSSKKTHTERQSYSTSLSRICWPLIIVSMSASFWNMTPKKSPAKWKFLKPGNSRGYRPPRKVARSMYEMSLWKLPAGS